MRYEHYDYVLEYEDNPEKALDFLEWETDIEFDYKWEEDTLIVFTDVEPSKVEEMIYDATGVYATSYGDNY